MQDLVKQIVDMDRKAREITEAAQRDKVNSEKEIAKKREEIRAQFLTRARERIQLNMPMEQKAAEEAWEQLRAENESIAARLDARYAEKGDEWVAALVSRVTGE